MEVKPKINTKRAVFLDRDGVLIENIDGDYVRTLDQIRVLPGAKESVIKLFKAGFAPVIVTNQAAVAKGFITLQEAWAIQHVVVAAIAGDASVVSVICPHDRADNCNCRKPKPGMLLRAAVENKLDLAGSFLIGDALTDMSAARSAGVAPFFVLTGRGRSEYAIAEPSDLKDIEIFPTIVEAVEHILNLEGGNNG